MSLESEINQLLDTLLTAELIDPISNQALIKAIDLTLLDRAASQEALANLHSLAAVNPVAAICLYPEHLKFFKDLPASIQLATVINFPLGTQDISTNFREIDYAVAEGATEIDYVFPYQAYLANENKFSLIRDCQELLVYAKKQNLIFKVIMETGAFPDMERIYALSRDLIGIGCDFLKTSTGKINQGASLSAACAMLSAIKDTHTNCGLKVSGGIKTPFNAKQYASLAQSIIKKPIDPSWFRIGASSLLYELVT